MIGLLPILVIIHTETEEQRASLLRIVAGVAKRYPHGDGEFLLRQHNRLLAAAFRRQASRLGVAQDAMKYKNKT